MTTRTIATMLAGHIVEARIVGTVPHRAGEYVCAFVRHVESGATRLCLDLGSKAWAEPGYTFTTRQINIDRAASLLGPCHPLV